MSNPTITAGDILYQDKHIIAVKKPAGLMVEPDKYGHPNAVEQVLALLPHPPKKLKGGLGVFYRLDRPVSGILIFALKNSALKDLNHQVESRTIKKVYRAEVEGKMEKESGVWNWSLDRTEDRKRAIVSEKGKKSETRWKVIERGFNSTILEIQITTGRFHQIRAHAAKAGFPIVGDEIYGSNVRKAHGIRLHAYSYAFDHPADHKRMILIADNFNF